MLLPIRPIDTLHSTMFLLIRIAFNAPMTPLTAFTFHNVSINTAFCGGNDHDDCILYIPQCFY